LQVVYELINTALEINAEKVFIITSNSVDGKNPLLCSGESMPTTKNVKEQIAVSKLFGTEGEPPYYKFNVITDLINAYKQKLIAELLVKQRAEGDFVDLETSEEDKRRKTLSDQNIEKIRDLKIIVKCSSGNPFKFIHTVIHDEFLIKDETILNMFFIAGRDRAPFLDRVVKYFSEIEYIQDKDRRIYIESIDGKILERPGMRKLIESNICTEGGITGIDPCAYSASFIRGLVAQRKWEEFYQVYEPYIRYGFTRENITYLYETIEKGLQLPSKATKLEDENQTSEWFDNGRLPFVREFGMTLPIEGAAVEPPLPYGPIYQSGPAVVEPVDEGGGKRKRTRKYKKNKRKTKQRKRF
jgi:hypothetical protein